jgi:integrase
VSISVATSSRPGTRLARLKPFVRDFGARRFDIGRREAKDWAFGEGRWEDQGPPRSGTLQSVVSLHNYAADEDDLDLPRNPFRGLGKRTRGRADEPPPTLAEFERLLGACAGLGAYGPKFRAMMLFASVTLLRPSELYMLKWTDLDLDRARMRKQLRLYRGDVDEPKYGKATVYLPPPAVEALEALDHHSEYVFTSKTGKRLSQAGMSGYWSIVKAVAGLDFDFYHATKHYGVHFLWTRLGVSRRGIAAQAGWSIATVDKMLSIYGHGEVGALEEVEAAWSDADAGTVPRAAAGAPAEAIMNGAVRESVMPA